MICTYYTVLYDEICYMHYYKFFMVVKNKVIFFVTRMCRLVDVHQHSVFITWVGRSGGEEGKSVPTKYW